MVPTIPFKASNAETVWYAAAAKSLSVDITRASSASNFRAGSCEITQIVPTASPST